jgi:uncharacterized protein
MIVICSSRLVDAWPRETRVDRRRFELLKSAYVEARYSASYEIGIEDLDAIAASVNNPGHRGAIVSRDAGRTAPRVAGV